MTDERIMLSADTSVTLLPVKHRANVDLIADHRGDVGRAADEARHFGFDALIFEIAALDRDEVRQRRTDREDADFDFVERRRGIGERRQRDGRDSQALHGSCDELHLNFLPVCG